jgi:hypothetical protein
VDSTLLNQSNGFSLLQYYLYVSTMFIMRLTAWRPNQSSLLNVAWLFHPSVATIDPGRMHCIITSFRVSICCYSLLRKNAFRLFFLQPKHLQHNGLSYIFSPGFASSSCPPLPVRLFLLRLLLFLECPVLLRFLHSCPVSLRCPVTVVMVEKKSLLTTNT